MKNTGALIVNAILAANASLIVEKRKSISFELDHEGKRLINLEVNKLYNKYFKPDYDSLACIVITIHVVMEKMSTLKWNGWSMYELRDQVESGLIQCNDRTKNRLVELSQTPVMKIVQETPAVKGSFHEKFPATMKTLDGHFVRSKSEILIDNFLYIQYPYCLLHS